MHAVPAWVWIESSRHLYYSYSSTQKSTNPSTKVTMKTLLYQSLLIFSLCAIGSCIALREEIYTIGEGIDCTDIGGTVPIPIFNSPYTILPNGSLCCPKYIGDFCEDEKVIAGDKCRGRGLVYEPCHFCKTCAKLAGESCGGHQNLYGTCDEGLECVEADQNSTHGICYGKGMPLKESCRLFNRLLPMISELCALNTLITYMACVNESATSSDYKYNI